MKKVLRTRGGFRWGSWVLVSGAASFPAAPAGGQLNFVAEELSSGSASSWVYAWPATAVGDFNGDGFPDVAFREDSPTVLFRVLWGPGFSLPYTTVAFPALPNGMAISPRSGDVNGDGFDDLLVGAVVWGGPGATPGEIVIRYGPSLTAESVATFSLPGGSYAFGYSYEVADLDGNGSSDIVSMVSTSPPVSGFATAYLQVLYGPVFSGGVTLSVPSWASGSYFGAMSADGDFTGDGLPDIVFTTLPTGTDLAVGFFPGPSFQSSSATILAYPIPTVGLGLLWAGDLTGDGIADAVLTNEILNPVNGIYQGEVLGIPSPTFGVTIPLLGPWGTLTFPGAVEGGDLDGDGLRDLAVGYFGGSVFFPGVIRVGYGPSFSTTQEFSGPSSGAALGGQIFLEDVDGDGFREVISPAGGDNKVMVYRPRTLTASGTGVSLSAGGSVTLSIDASPSHGGEAYLIGCSTTSTFPGTVVGNIRVPLIVDAFTVAALAVVNSPVFANFAGSLDANGEATATLAVPPGAFANPALIGLTINFADVVLNPAMTEVQVSSNPVAVTLLP